MRKVTLLVVSLVMALALAGPAAAQGPGEFCLGLGDEDCALYYQLSDVQTASSASFEAVMSVKAVVPEEDPLSFSGAASGTYVYNLDEYNAFVEEAYATPLRDVSIGTFYDWFMVGIDAFDGELQITADVPAEFQPMIGMDQVTLDLYLIDGDAYLDFTPISELMGDPSMAGVFGVDLSEASDVGLSTTTLGDILQPMGGMDDMGMDDDMMDDDMDGNPIDEIQQGIEELQQSLDELNQELETFQQEQSDQFNGLIEAIDSLTEEDIMAYATISRLDDETIDGVDVAVFQTDVTLSAIYEVEAIREIARAVIELSDEPLPPGFEIDALFDSFAASIQNDTYVITEKYGIDDGYLYEMDLALAFDIDPEPIAEALGEPLPTGPGAPDMTASFTITYNVMRSGFNEIESVELPEGAELIPLEALAAMGGAF
ncbi:MAG: hypothetical protein AAF125_10600 [Chloroflexota bacterium]